MKGVRHIFFDLDHTLWDYDTNARLVLEAIYHHFQIDLHTQKDMRTFLETFFHENGRLWNDYNHGRIDKEVIRTERFTRVIGRLGYEDAVVGLQMSAFFLENCPRQSAMMPDAALALNYLSRKYTMSIITNGFDDTQALKLKSSGIHHHFQRVFTSETIGFKKPSPEIFEFALSELGLKREETVMIGDNPSTDIQGAHNAGIAAVLYNPDGKMRSNAQWEVRSLFDLMKIL